MALPCSAPVAELGYVPTGSEALAPFAVSVLNPPPGSKPFSREFLLISWRSMWKSSGIYDGSCGTFTKDTPRSSQDLREGPGR